MHRHYRFSKVLVAVAIAAAGIVLGGCTGVGGEDGEYLGGTSSDTGPADPTGVGEAPSGPKPPESTLTLGKRTKTGMLGSYCWESVSGATEAATGCADATGIPVPREDEALTVPQDWVLVFDYGGRGRPASVDASAYLLDRDSELRCPPGGRFLSPTEGRSVLEAGDLRVSRLGDRAQIPVGLPEGEYVVEVSVQVPEGDTAYYFRVVVV